MRMRQRTSRWGRVGDGDDEPSFPSRGSENGVWRKRVMSMGELGPSAGTGLYCFEVGREMLVRRGKEMLNAQRSKMVLLEATSILLLCLG